MNSLIAVWTFVNDCGQWAAIGGLAILACRAEMRARAAEHRAARR